MLKLDVENAQDPDRRADDRIFRRRPRHLANEAALQATRRDHPAVELADFTLAIERIVAGLEKRNRLLNPLERRIVAHHEMGHALVALSLPGSDPVHKVSIIPRGISTLGYTLQRPTEDRFLMTRADLDKKMAVLLGGRAAEQVVFGELSTGAADDLAKASDIARSMVMRYGMDEALGPVAYDSEHPTPLALEGLAPPPRTYAEATAREIDLATRKLVDAALARNLELLARRRAALERSAQALLSRETLTDTDLRSLLDDAAAT